MNARSSSKKILFVGDRLVYGGVEKTTIIFANYLADAGYDVTIALLTKNNTLKHLLSSKVRVVFMLNHRMWVSLLPFVFFLWREKFDVIISAIDFINLFTLIACKFFAVPSPCIVSIRTYLSMEKKYIQHPKIQTSLRLAPYLYPLADHIVAVSHGVARDAEMLFGLKPQSIKTIYNPSGKPQEFFEHLPEISHPFFDNPEQNGPCILAAGRLVVQKNYTLLIQAFAVLIQTYKAKLIILGDGELRTALQEQILNSNLQDHVALLGNVAKLEAYMKRANLFVSTSLWEGFGNAIVEALSVGCPVLSLDTPHGPREILSDGLYGHIARYDITPEDLAKDMVLCLNKKHDKILLQKRGQMFLPEIAAQKYLALVNIKQQPTS